MNGNKCYHRIDETSKGDPVANRYPIVRSGTYGDYVVHTSPNQTEEGPSSQMSCVCKKNTRRPILGFATTEVEAWEKYYQRNLLKLIKLEVQVNHLKANVKIANDHIYAEGH